LLASIFLFLTLNFNYQLTIANMEHKVFWCKVNQYYLNQRLQYFRKTNKQDPNSIIIASCEVTDRAKGKWIKEVLFHINSWKKVYLTWCGSIQRGNVVNTDLFYSRFPQLQKYKNQIKLLPESPRKFTDLKTPLLDKGGAGGGFVHEEGLLTRKPIIIQTGCDNYCTFCLTIYKRGAHQSRPSAEIIKEINDFHAQWGNEIVLTGINLAARWCDNSRNPQTSRFTQLLTDIINKTQIPRIRISSLWPEYLDNQFFDIIQNPRFMTHFHFSIQSFSDKILTDMRRNYNRNQLDKVLTKIRYNQDISIWADIITGFPGEDEDTFLETYNAISQYQITKLHAFPFSPHIKGQTVPASTHNNQLPNELKKLNNQRLIAIWDQIRSNFIQTQHWKTFKVLLEQKKGDLRQGRTPNYIQIKTSWDYHNNQLIDHIL